MERTALADLGPVVGVLSVQVEIIIAADLEVTFERFNAFTSKYSGLKALEHLLCDDAIINETTRDDWIVWLTFLYKTTLQASFAAAYAELIGGWRGRITRLLEDAKQAHEVPQDLDVEFEAIAIWAFSAGVGQLGLLHPNMLPVKVQKQLISAYLDKLRAH